MFRVQSFHSPYECLQLPSEYDHTKLVAASEELHNRAEGELDAVLHLPAPQVPAREAEIAIADALEWLTAHAPAPR